MFNNRSSNFLVLVLILGLSACSTPSVEEQVKKRPNILLIVADDLAYADLGCYGGDIETPNIDALAARGLRFSRFHTSPYCAPTRAMLLSGNDNHIAGMGIQNYKTDSFGYEGKLSDRIASIPEVLKEAGYHTYMTGKWHLGTDSLSNPLHRGFEKSFVNLLWGGNHYNNIGLVRSAPVSIYTEHGKEKEWPEGAYSTDFYTDKLIQYLEEDKADGQPFFIYAAYTSPHWPLQVEDKYWKKYEGRYDEGYDVLKKKRLESLKKAKMIPEEAILPPNHESVTPWESLSASDQKKEARKMELYAGMVDNLDVNIGRLLNYLEENGALENTFIVFMSDNGAAAEDFYNDPAYQEFLREHYNNDFENMGKEVSFVSYGPQWAEAGSAPFKYYKSQTTEGGIVAPMLIAGPEVNWENDIFHGFTTVMDLAPTFFDLAQATYPDSLKNKKLYPLRGNSLKDLLTKETQRVHPADYVFGLEYRNRGLLRKGDWKLLNNENPYHKDNFKLYNLSEDLAEVKDVKDQAPEVYQELLKEWDQFIQEIQAQFPPPKRKK